MKRRSFLGVIAGAFVAPKVRLPSETIAAEPALSVAPISGAYYPPVFSVKLWSKALERDILMTAPFNFHSGGSVEIPAGGCVVKSVECNIGEMSTISIKRPDPESFVTFA